FVVQCDARDVDDVSAALDRIMRDASAVVLRRFELPTDCQIIRPGERYFDKRGKAMWDTLTRLLAKREREGALWEPRTGAPRGRRATTGWVRPTGMAPCHVPKRAMAPSPWQGCHEWDGKPGRSISTPLVWYSAANV